MAVARYRMLCLVFIKLKYLKSNSPMTYFPPQTETPIVPCPVYADKAKRRIDNTDIDRKLIVWSLPYMVIPIQTRPLSKSSLFHRISPVYIAICHPERSVRETIESKVRRPSVFYMSVCILQFWRSPRHIDSSFFFQFSRFKFPLNNIKLKCLPFYCGCRCCSIDYPPV